MLQHRKIAYCTPGPASCQPRVLEEVAPASGATRYDATARWLHWLSAVVILWAMGSGISIAVFDPDPGLKNVITSFNVALTTLFIPFFAWRCWHALRSIKPVNPALTGRNHRIAGLAHFGLYALVAVVQVSGLLMMDHAYNLFGSFQMPNLVTDPVVNGNAAIIHTHACRVLALLVAIHLGAVIFHHLCGRKIMSSML
jgi:cytochrome b561